MAEPTIPGEAPSAAVQARPKRRWASVLALSSAAFVDSSEDQALSVLWPNMHRTLGLTVGQLGPVLGIAGVVRTLTLPFWGYVADHFSRKALLVLITGIWGLWTAAVGLVDSLPQLVAVRVMSSLGLGVLWPTAFSLLSDLFSSKERGRAAGIMAAVSFTGSIAAFGILPAIAVASPEAWRTGFVVMGLASSFTGLLLLVVNDPPRGSAEPELSDVINEDMVARYAFRLSDLPVIAKVRTWWVLLVHTAIDNLSLSILYGWAFTWLDSIGLSGSGFIIVALMAVGNLTGHLLFGWLGDVLEQRYHRRGRPVMALVGLTVTVPALAALIGVGSSNTQYLFIFGMIAGIALSSVDTGARWPIAQAVLRPELRATGRASIDMVVGVLGAIMVSFSGFVADRVGVVTMMLLLVPLPKLLGALSWIPVLWTYGEDRQALHETLQARRLEYVGSAGTS